MQTLESTSVDYEYLAPVEATSLSPAFYQNLLDRCWRRSGTTIYRPNQARSCCPYYTIRLDSGRFKPSRNQRQTVNRFTKFVCGDAYVKEAARLYPKTREDVRRRDNEFSLLDRIHEAEYDRLRLPPEPAHKFVVTLEVDTFTEEKYQVFDNYQRVVHNDPPSKRTREAFVRFLCSSPLRRGFLVEEGQGRKRLGSYHQCYRLDGVLVAMGVLDLLPTCVSSVYFLYHESIDKHAPGKLGALHEIALALEEGYQWWYPGYYIHNCPKMKYKIDYSPQFILDPSTFCWDPLDSTVLSLLDQKPFVSLSMERDGAVTSGQGTAGHDDNPDSGVRRRNEKGSLFRSGMPGISSVSDMMRVDLDHVALRISSAGPLFVMSDLVPHREEASFEDWHGFKASVAELVAAIGPDMVERLCLDVTIGN
ncbi:hypothetical protein E4U42_002502 [Claviceps africana]|uniref:Arginyl-tRNA--protein transferase 1 n=1 Tax=Claviceps africana TaxID=83212 RepID=A0A8K0J8P5_9HYPO|nr:hypothetical protein E4U42_002502 [Claviceps africana]